ncbi:MAG: hypothetical protein ACE14V_05055 [bacterium]
MKLNILIAILVIIFCLILAYDYIIHPLILAQGENKLTTITCSDNQHRYIVYLPKHYFKNKDTKAYPVLFCFDPGKNATNAVTQFLYASHKYEWIIVGSLDAENGDWPPILQAQEAMLLDIPKRFHVDEKKYYATGFSGGARMAYTIAYLHPKQFKAVIPCGAGFGLPPVSKTIPVYHCIGDSDSNLDEVKRAYNYLQYFKDSTQLAIFLGGHQWPPEQVRKDAIDWIAAQ